VSDSPGTGGHEEEAAGPLAELASEDAQAPGAATNVKVAERSTPRGVPPRLRVTEGRWSGRAAYGAPEGRGRDAAVGERAG